VKIAINLCVFHQPIWLAARGHRQEDVLNWKASAKSRQLRWSKWKTLQEASRLMMDQFSSEVIKQFRLE
jgi:hypothetical protein